MTAEPINAGPRPRVRPHLHFTAPTGWINDPHAIAYLDGRYHLFYQHNPDAPVWSPHCHWGHATSPRLVGWTDHGDVLSPDDVDTGVWSGAIAVDDDRAMLLYTSIGDGDWSDGAISIASGTADGMIWTKDPRNPVVSGPPPGVDTAAFRDPYVWRDAAGWAMVVGVGLRGAGGALARHTSPDLVKWMFQGMVEITGSLAVDDGVFTGDMWECPQLFELDGSWVLMFSVQDQHHVLHDVVYAIGSLKGHTFEVRRWGKFSRGPVPYATTTFHDAAGDRVAISWLRERPDAAVDTFAGAHSLPVRLTVANDHLIATPHHDVVALRRLIGAPLSEPLTSDAAITVSAELARSGLAVLDGTTGATLAEVSTATERPILAINAIGSAPIDVPTTAGVVEVTVVIDADIIEIFSPHIEGVVGLRLPAAPTTTTVAATSADVTAVERYRLALD